MTPPGQLVAGPVRSVRLLQPLGALEEFFGYQKAVREFVLRGLTEGVDYGVIPGTQPRQKRDLEGKPVKVNNKPVMEAVRSLLKPGAEKVANFFGLAISYEVDQAEVEHFTLVQWRKRRKQWTRDGETPKPDIVTDGESLGLYRYRVRCILTEVETGLVRGTCLGLCSSLESKYVDRPHEVENTILKQAEKRSLTGVVLNTFGLSDEFTQDLEEDVEVEAEIEHRKDARAERMGQKPAPLATLAEAGAVTVLGAKGPQNPYGGEPLSVVPLRWLVKNYAPYLERQIQGAEERGEDSYQEAHRLVAVHMLEAAAKAAAPAVTPAVTPPAAPVAPAAPLPIATPATDARDPFTDDDEEGF